MSVQMEASWKSKLKDVFKTPDFEKLTAFVRSEYERGPVYPAPKQIFYAFDQCPFDQVKVVILGQDPYHGPRQAHGLCFSVRDGVRKPPSLVNIFKEIRAELGGEVPESGDLSPWSEQGVLLLNATLTVRAGQAGSHQKQGWEEFTDAVIAKLSEEKDHLVFMLWGRYAQNKGAHIDRQKHLVLEAAHPSPLSAHNGFFGCGHFKKCNDYLAWHGQESIEWFKA